MKNFKKLLLTLGVILSATLLVACSGASDKEPKESAMSDDAIAKADAQIVLDFMYKGKISGFSDVAYASPDQVEADLIEASEQNQIDKIEKNGNLNDYELIVDGSNYTAEEIISEFAQAYYDQAATIGDATVKSVEVSGDTAKVTATLTPIAALSEANPIGNARTELFGGLDNDTIIRQSGNKDVETIQKLITLKLYGMYYGQMGKTAEKGPETVEITFNLKKDGDHFKADEDTILQLARDARADVYADSASSSSESDSSSVKS